MENSQPAQIVPVSLKASVFDWPNWWKGRTLFQKLFPATVLISYLTLLYRANGLRNDHFTLVVILLVLSYVGRVGSNLLKFCLPFALTGILYDSQRYWGNFIRGRIRVTEPYYFDLHFFGIQTPQGILTPNEWWQLHLHPALDLITGIAYLAFFTLFILLSGYFYFYLGKKGTARFKPAEIALRARRMPWAFFWLNALGYSTYYWFPAAPPWYVSTYGLGPVKLDAPASLAGCARFDQLIGIPVFSGMYGRAADVFGAIPSLHVAYPLLATYFAFYLGAARSFCIGFYLTMCFSAVYLNHHYLLDILWGSAYALLVGWGINFIFDRKDRAQL